MITELPTAPIVSGEPMPVRPLHNLVLAVEEKAETVAVPTVEGNGLSHIAEAVPLASGLVSVVHSSRERHMARVVACGPKCRVLRPGDRVVCNPEHPPRSTITADDGLEWYIAPETNDGEQTAFFVCRLAS